MHIRFIRGFERPQAIARIAENHLTPQSKAMIKQLLGDQPITEMAAEMSLFTSASTRTQRSFLWAKR